MNKLERSKGSFQNEVQSYKVENMKNFEHVNMKRMNIHCMGILDEEEIGRK